MTTVMMPPEGELLRAVREGVEAEPEPVRTWPQRSFQLCLDLLRRIRESAGEARQALAEELAAGVEARSFARTYGEFLPAADEFVTMVQELREFLSPLEDPPSQRLAAEVRLLERENQALHDLLAKALSRVSEPCRPIDWGGVRTVEEAHARGETKPFSRQ